MNIYELRSKLINLGKSTRNFPQQRRKSDPIFIIKSSNRTRFSGISFANKVGLPSVLTSSCSTNINYIDQFLLSLGVDFQIRTMTVQGRYIALQLWDTAGQERYVNVVDRSNTQPESKATSSRCF